MRPGLPALAALSMLVSAGGSAGCSQRDATSRGGAGSSASSSSTGAAASQPSGSGRDDVSALRLSTERAEGGGRVLVVENHAVGPVNLSTRLALERRASGRWRHEDVDDLRLRMSCEGAVPECVVLVPGAELRPPAWSARTGAAQCRQCPTCAPVHPGTFRFVVTSCNGSSAARSDTFEMGN